MNSINDVKNLFTERLKELADENKIEPKDLTIIIQKYKDERPGSKRDEMVFLEYIRKEDAEKPGQKTTVFNRELNIAKQIVKVKQLVDFNQKERKLRTALEFIANMLREELMQANKESGGCSLYEVRVMVYTVENDPIIPVMEIYKEGSNGGRRLLTWKELEDITG